MSRKVVREPRRIAVRRLIRNSLPRFESVEPRTLLSTIAQWAYPGVIAAPYNTSAATSGTGSATQLGMTNSYPEATGAGSVANGDVLSSPSLANASFSEDTWRIRGAAGAGTTGPANGWSNSAPQYSQGVEFDTDTTGFKNITLGFDWFSSTQGIRDLQEQYTLDTTAASPIWTNINSPLIAVPNDFYGSSASAAPTGATVDLSGISGANNNPHLGVRLVSTYDAGLPGKYASATLTGGNPVQYNNSSGNWRFGNIHFDGIIPVAPSITTQPTDQLATNGNTATFTAAASGAPTPTEQWQVSTNGGSTFSNITGATGTSYAVVASPTTNGNRFRAIFTNSEGSATTNAATLSIVAVPVVTTQPSDVVVSAGQTATFTAAASGNPTSVQWQVSTNGGTSFSNIAGATSATYSFTASGDQAGNLYRAVFTNAAGPTTSNAARLSVIGTPITVWSFDPANGGPGTVAPSDNSPPTIVGNGTAQVLGMDNTYTSFYSFADADVTLSQGPTNSNFSEYTWRVRGGPNFNVAGGTPNGWSNLAPQYSQGAEFDVPTTGYKNITIGFDWFSTSSAVRDMQVQYTLDGSNWLNYSSPLLAVSNDYYGATATGSPTGVLVNLQSIAGANNNPSLGLRLVSAYDPAESAVAGSPAYASAAGTDANPLPYGEGSGNWRFDNITFNGTTLGGQPGITAQPASKIVIVGNSVTFTATAIGTPTPTEQWQVSADSGSSWSDIAGATQTSYTFTPTIGDDGKLYRAVFTNAEGTATTNAATLDVVTPVAPSVTTPPKNLSVLSGAQASFTAIASGIPAPTVQWQISTNGGSSFSNVPGATFTTYTFFASVGQTGNQYRAVFTSGAGSVTSSAATLSVIQAGTAITNWKFPGAVTPTYNNPAPTLGSGNASLVGFTLTTDHAIDPASPSVPAGDVALTSSIVDPQFNEYVWRARGATTETTIPGAPGNGWSNFAPQYSQGVEFDVPTTGYKNIYVTLDWYATNQGVRDLQVQYTLNGSTWVNLGSTLQAIPNEFYGATSTGPTGVLVDLTGVAGANNNANLGIRLVSAYDDALPGEYASATLANGVPVQYNGSSGNWRFGNIAFNGTASVALPAWLASNSQATWDASSHTLTVTGPTTIVADPGTDAPIVNASGSAAVVTISPTADQKIHLGGLNLTNGATANVTSVGAGRTALNHRLLVVDGTQLSIDATSTLDLTDNDLVVHNATTGGSAIRTLIARGYHSGAWNGTGIRSSAAGASSSTSLGSKLNDGSQGPAVTKFGPGATADQQAVTATDYLVSYTAAGDANVNQAVEFNDLVSLAQHYGASAGVTWSSGDFNYDGLVNFSDLVILAQHYGAAASLMASLTVPITNPGVPIASGGSQSIGSLNDDGRNDILDSTATAGSTAKTSTASVFATKARVR